MDTREVPPTTEPGHRSVSSAAKPCRRSSRARLDWLEGAPDEVLADVGRESGMYLLGRTAVDWILRTSAGKPRKRRSTAPTA
jgi:hypothetical protein